MRTIKFRAWDKKGNGWIAGFNMFGFSNYAGGDKHIQRFGTEWYHDDYVIDQFTGLLDKNGKEIYEGDVVRFLRGGGLGFDVKGKTLNHVGQIGWCIERCHFSFCYNFTTGGGYATFGLEFTDSRFTDVSFEVIGNIHESPELMEKS